MSGETSCALKQQKNKRRKTMKFSGGYTQKEMKNKYRFQERWQRKNNYVSCSFRMDNETIGMLSVLSELTNTPKAKILEKSFENYIENLDAVSFEKQYLHYVVNTNRREKLTFRGKQEFFEEIDKISKGKDYMKGAFVVTLTRLYLKELLKDM